MNEISAVVITRNEEAKLAAALDSLSAVADEIVVVDSGSEDATVDIARGYTDNVVVEPWRGYREQKQFATDRARCRWVLSLDADERLSPELQEELAGWKLDSEPAAAGYRIPRLSWFMGRWIRHTIWYPDRQLRLFDRSRGRWQGQRVHEAVNVEGPVADLQHPIEHFSYSNVSEYLTQLENFSELAAADLLDRGQQASFVRLAVSPPAVFLKSYLVRRGFLDGAPGLAVSVMAATSTFFKLLKLRELRQDKVRRRVQ